MDAIVTTALVGTARQERVNAATGTPVDGLIDGLSACEDERKLLLSAGAWAVYRQAGQRPQQLATVPEPAAPERLRACSAPAALLLERLLNGEQAELLPEALQRLREVGMYLPHRLLPLALTKVSKEQRAVLVPVLGERGRWLSQFNSSWDWVHNFLTSDESGLPADAETIWQEGTAGQRVEILRRLRVVDPAQARTWIEGVWKQEKADMRCDLLYALEIGLDAADEAWLEQALDDRAPSVRLVAANLLARIPTSAFVARMCTRGSGMLKLVNGTIDLEVPATFDKSWLRDGIVEKPFSHLGQRAWWLIQILAAIPPMFWETQLGAGPMELLERLPDDEWRINVVEGWSKAAISYRHATWLKPLWHWWYTHFKQQTARHVGDYEIQEKLLQAMSQREAEATVLPLLNDAQNFQPDIWETLLSALSKPWSHAFGQAYLRFAREYYQKRLMAIQPIAQPDPSLDTLLNSFPNAALALPSTCFGEAQREWEHVEEGLPWYVTRINESVRAFIETIHMRQTIYEEII